jgi:hypothetical protein
MLPLLVGCNEPNMTVDRPEAAEDSEGARPKICNTKMNNK